MKRQTSVQIVIRSAAIILPLIAGNAVAQDAPVVIEQPQSDTMDSNEIEQLVAPIALYPDTLIAQMLPAATYPSEITAAEQWLAANPNPTEPAIDAQPFEPSIKAVMHYPTVLKWMNDNLDAIQSLGVAFLNQQPDVMAAIQRLRAQAQNVGSLQSTPQQQVESSADGIEIVPTDPNLVYVPEYDPSIAYVGGSGTWPYVTFSVGFPLGIWLDNGIDWHHHWIAEHHGWNHGWDHNGEHGLPKGGWADSDRWARNRSVPPPAFNRARTAAPRNIPLRPGYERPAEHPTPAPAPNVFRGYQSNQGVQREVNRAHESRPAPAPQARPAPAPVHTEAPHEAPAGGGMRNGGGGEAPHASGSSPGGSEGAGHSSGGGGGHR